MVKLRKKKKMFVCVECKQKTKEQNRVFEGQEWCQTCYDKETQRSIKEDSTNKPYVRTRPPKYMLNPNEYKKFGY